MYKYVIMQLPEGNQVYVNMLNSSAGQYLSRQPYILNLLKEVLLNTKFTNGHMRIEQDMGRIIGTTDIIETTDTDTIFYARVNKKTAFSRYAKNRQPVPSRTLTILITQDMQGHYEVQDTWIGPLSPPFPGDENEMETSKSYWQTHALAQDSQAVLSKTITKDCPYA